MYTQCSKCETVFKLSAEVLRAAGGQVRCGKCGEVFNALARLAEEPTAFAAGESALDLETRADSILETVVAPQVARAVAKDYEDFAPPGVEIAQLEVLDWSEEDQARHRNAGAPDDGRRDADARDDDAHDASEESADRLMEFTLPPGELDRIFVESKNRAARPARPSVSQAARQPAPPEAVVESQRDPDPDFEPEPPHPESADIPAAPQSRQRFRGVGTSAPRDAGGVRATCATG